MAVILQSQACENAFFKTRWSKRLDRIHIELGVSVKGLIVSNLVSLTYLADFHGCGSTCTTNSCVMEMYDPGSREMTGKRLLQLQSGMTPN